MKVLWWLICTQLLYLLALPAWFVMAAMSVMSFDAPGSEKKLGPWLFVSAIWLAPLFPLTCSVLSWIFYRQGHARRAAITTSIPLLAILPLIVLLAVATALAPFSIKNHKIDPGASPPATREKE